MNSTIKNLYQKIIEFGLSKEELDNQIRIKTKEYAGFLSLQGILFIIAKEYGYDLHSNEILTEHYNFIEEKINYDDFTIEISDVREGMLNLILLGKIIKIFNFSNFSRKDRTLGTVGSFLIGDPSGIIKVVVWDEMVDLLKNELFQENLLVRIIGGYSKIGSNKRLEVHLGKKGRIILAPDDVDPEKQKLFESMQLKRKIDINLPIEFPLKIKELIDRYKFIHKVRGTIYLEEFKEIITRSGDKTFLLKFFLKDETMTIRVVVWGMEAIECLKYLEDGAVIELSNLLVKKNSYTNEKELVFVKNSSLNLNSHV